MMVTANATHTVERNLVDSSIVAVLSQLWETVQEWNEVNKIASLLYIHLVSR